MRRVPMRSSQTESAMETTSRQCWECRKLRLVCDFSLPHCKKCIKNGKACPGYGNQKPLQWVDGVTSRRRRRIAPSTAQLNEAIRTQAVCQHVQVEEWVRKLATKLEEAQNRWKKDVTKRRGLEYEEFQFISRRAIEMVLVRKYRTEEKGRILLQLDDETLQRTLKYMTDNQLPAYELQSETCEVVQAVQYFNMRIHPQLIEGALTPNPHFFAFPPAVLHLLPPAVHHNIVVLAVSHYVHSLPPGQGNEIASLHAPKILHHRGATIREISQRLSGKLRTNNGTLVSILMLMCSELQQNNPRGWRVHAGGLLRLFECRGGMMNIYHTSPQVRSTVVIFTYIVIYSNAGTRATDQLLPFPSVEEQVAIVKAMFDELFPYCLVPLSLFEAMIRINYLRYHAATDKDGDLAAFSIQAREILDGIDSFDPQDWAQPGINHDAWLTLARVFKASLAVYCIMSSQSLGAFPRDTAMNRELDIHADNLLRHLKAAFLLPNVTRYLTWPLAVVGVHAAYRGEGVRTWVERELLNMSLTVGAYFPLRISNMLRRNWDSGKYGWEEYFNEPQAFLM